MASKNQVNRFLAYLSTQTKQVIHLPDDISFKEKCLTEIIIVGIEINIRVGKIRLRLVTDKLTCQISSGLRNLAPRVAKSHIRT